MKTMPVITFGTFEGGYLPTQMLMEKIDHETLPETGTDESDEQVNMSEYKPEVEQVKTPEAPEALKGKDAEFASAVWHIVANQPVAVNGLAREAFVDDTQSAEVRF